MQLTPTQKAESYWGLANEYRLAASTLFDSSAQTYRPAIYLLCHSIELGLKSLLILHGTTDKDLKAHGHCILSSLKVVGESMFSGKAIHAVSQLNDYYAGKEMEYFFARSMTYGNLDEIRSVADEILDVALRRIMNTSNGV